MASPSLFVPPWLDAEFFEMVLKKSENNRTIKVHGCNLSSGSKAGAHFASVIFRAKVEYSGVNVETRQVSLIVKTTQFEGEKSEASLLTDGRIFVRESQVYSKVMTDMQRLLKQSGDDVELGPRLIYSSNFPAWLLVFEDLTERGYEAKTTLLNFEEMTMAMTKIAKWHAASYYLGKTDPQSPITEYESLLFDEEISDLDALFGDAFRYLRKAVAKWPGDNELVLSKLGGVTKKWFKRGQAAYKGATEFCVMNHADFHFKNIMVKGHDGVLEDLLFIDYQVCTWSSPAIDLIYALYAMASIETRNEHRNALLSVYYATFSGTLKKIGHIGRVPTFLDLQVELLRCGFLEVLVAAVFLPYYSLDLSKPVPGVDMTKLFDPAYGIDFRQFVCEQPEYTKDMQKWLPRFVYRGYLD